MFEGGLNEIDAVAKAFDFCDHFRKEAARLESSIKETAGVPAVLFEQEKNLLSNLAVVESMLLQQSQLPTEAVAVQEEN